MPTDLPVQEAVDERRFADVWESDDAGADWSGLQPTLCPLCIDGYCRGQQCLPQRRHAAAEFPVGPEGLDALGLEVLGPQPTVCRLDGVGAVDDEKPGLGPDPCGDLTNEGWGWETNLGEVI